MKTKYIPAKYKKEIKITKNFLKFIKKEIPKGNLIILSSIQYLHIHNNLKKQLEQLGYNITQTKPKRCKETNQILGCNCYIENLNLKKETLKKINAFIYLGDGNFHPKAIELSQHKTLKKPIITYNLYDNNYKIIKNQDIEKIIKKRNANLAKFLLSKNIGIFISTKFGQSQEKYAKTLENKFKNKKFYYFIGDNFNNEELENFNFIETWINTACPRIGLDDLTSIKKPLINLKDIEKLEI